MQRYDWVATAAQPGKIDSITNLQTKQALPDRMAIRLRVTHANTSAISLRHSPQLDCSSQRALISSFASLREYHCVFPYRTLRLES